MLDDTSDIAYRGITRLENELLVRDFIDVMNYRDPSALTPFLHREIRYQGGRGQDVRGSRAVLRLCERFVRRLPDFQVQIRTISCVEQAVLVEETVRLGVGEGCSGHAIPAFAAFVIRDFQIVGWNQLYG